MAITLDELLGRNTREATQNNVTGFPSYVPESKEHWVICDKKVD